MDTLTIIPIASFHLILTYYLQTLPDLSGYYNVLIPHYFFLNCIIQALMSGAFLRAQLTTKSISTSSRFAQIIFHEAKFEW